MRFGILSTKAARQFGVFSSVCLHKILVGMIALTPAVLCYKLLAYLSSSNVSNKRETNFCSKISCIIGHTLGSTVRMRI